tara:strand:+ start:1505 stop:2278 length:774 start_codon:yes stop_codon:yes gene_type:complete
MLGEHFYNESFRKTIIAFGSLFNNISIFRKSKSGTKTQSLKVPLAYGPKQKFITRLEQDPAGTQSIAITLPRIGFEIQGFTYDPARKLNRIIKHKRVKEDTVKKLKSMTTQYTPVPYNVNFELFVMAKNSDDGIQIVEQILPYFQPEYTVTIKEIPEMSIVRDVPIILNDINYEDTYAGDFTERRAIIYTLNFSAKTYVYGPVSTQEQITKAQVDIYPDLPAETPSRHHRIVVEATRPPSSPDADDFGFNETISEWT